MATQGAMTIESFVAGSTISNYRFVAQAGDDGQVDIAAAGTKVAGVLQNGEVTVGQTAAVAVTGRPKIVAEGPLAPGDLVKVGAAGGGVIANAGSVAVATARTAGIAGELVTVDLTGSVVAQA